MKITNSSSRRRPLTYTDSIISLASLIFRGIPVPEMPTGSGHGSYDDVMMSFASQSSLTIVKFYLHDAVYL